MITVTVFTKHLESGKIKKVTESFGEMVKDSWAEYAKDLKARLRKGDHWLTKHYGTRYTQEILVHDWTDGMNGKLICKI